MSESLSSIEVIIAAGSNLGNREEMLQRAGVFLESISEGPVVKSSIWETDPMGPSKYPFLNGVVKIQWKSGEESLLNLLRQLKGFERECGRPENPERWGPRILDLDIIAAGSVSIRKENLVVPHPEYSKRWFVLAPLEEIDPNWTDPLDHTPIQTMMKQADALAIRKTTLSW